MSLNASKPNETNLHKEVEQEEPDEDNRRKAEIDNNFRRENDTDTSNQNGHANKGNRSNNANGLTTGIGKFKEKRPGPLDLKDIPLDLSNKISDYSPDVRLRHHGQASHLIGGHPLLCPAADNDLTPLETPRIVWEDNGDLILDKARNFSTSSTLSGQQRLQLSSSLVGETSSPIMCSPASTNPLATLGLLGSDITSPLRSLLGQQPFDQPMSGANLRTPSDRDSISSLYHPRRSCSSDNLYAFSSFGSPVSQLQQLHSQALWSPFASPTPQNKTSFFNKLVDIRNYKRVQISPLVTKNLTSSASLSASATSSTNRFLYPSRCATGDPQSATLNYLSPSVQQPLTPTSMAATASLLNDIHLNSPTSKSGFEACSLSDLLAVSSQQQKQQLQQQQQQQQQRSPASTRYSGNSVHNMSENPLGPNYRKQLTNSISLSNELSNWAAALATNSCTNNSNSLNTPLISPNSFTAKSNFLASPVMSPIFDLQSPLFKFPPPISGPSSQHASSDNLLVSTLRNNSNKFTFPQISPTNKQTAQQIINQSHFGRQLDKNDRENNDATTIMSNQQLQSRTDHEDSKATDFAHLVTMARDKLSQTRPKHQKQPNHNNTSRIKQRCDSATSINNNNNIIININPKDSNETGLPLQMDIECEPEATHEPDVESQTNGLRDCNQVSGMLRPALKDATRVQSAAEQRDNWSLESQVQLDEVQARPVSTIPRILVSNCRQQHESQLQVAMDVDSNSQSHCGAISDMNRLPANVSMSNEANDNNEWHPNPQQITHSGSVNCVDSLANSGPQLGNANKCEMKRSLGPQNFRSRITHYQRERFESLSAPPDFSLYQDKNQLAALDLKDDECFVPRPQVSLHHASDQQLSDNNNNINISSSSINHNKTQVEAQQNLVEPAAKRQILLHSPHCCSQTGQTGSENQVDAGGYQQHALYVAGSTRSQSAEPHQRPTGTGWPLPIGPNTLARSTGHFDHSSCQAIYSFPELSQSVQHLHSLYRQPLAQHSNLNSNPNPIPSQPQIQSQAHSQMQAPMHTQAFARSWTAVDNYNQEPSSMQTAMSAAELGAFNPNTHNFNTANCCSSGGDMRILTTNHKLLNSQYLNASQQNIGAEKAKSDQSLNEPNNISGRFERTHRELPENPVDANHSMIARQQAWQAIYAEQSQNHNPNPNQSELIGPKIFNLPADQYQAAHQSQLISPTTRATQMGSISMGSLSNSNDPNSTNSGSIQGLGNQQQMHPMLACNSLSNQQQQEQQLANGPASLFGAGINESRDSSADSWPIQSNIHLDQQQSAHRTRGSSVSHQQRQHQQQHHHLHIQQQQQQQQQQQHMMQLQSDSNSNSSQFLDSTCFMNMSGSVGQPASGLAKLRPNPATKKYHCDQCPKSFTRSDMLTRHKRLHSGDRPFQCSECRQGFSRSDHLSTHMRTHTGEKPYSCEFCAYSACRKDMITRHLKIHDKAKNGNPNNYIVLNASSNGIGSSRSSSRNSNGSSNGANINGTSIKSVVDSSQTHINGVTR